MTKRKPSDVLREGVAFIRLVGIVYASGILRLTSERLEWQPFPFFQWFWRLSGVVVRTPVPHALSIEISSIATVDRGERLAIGAGPIFKRPLLVTSDGHAHACYIGVSVFDEGDDWLDDLRAILPVAEA